MVQPGADGKLATLSTFQPQFTYPIFGDEERIFGYDGLMIRLRFAAHNLSSNIVISYDRRFQTVDDVSAVDLNGALRPFLPDGECEPPLVSRYPLLTGGGCGTVSLQRPFGFLVSLRPS